MSDYGSYRFMGFWFQPDPVPMEEARPFGNNGFLKKYWNSDTYTQMPSNSMPNLFENYYNFNFDGTNYQNLYSYGQVIDNYSKAVEDYKGDTDTNENNSTVSGESSINLNSPNISNDNSSINLSENNSFMRIDYSSYFSSIFN